jgi:hypothetical protein
MSPVRVQRKRTKGWKAPLCSCGCGKTAIYVGRGTEWGNPWKVGNELNTETWAHDENSCAVVQTAYCRQFEVTPQLAVALYREAFALDEPFARRDLGGHDLMCWCSLDQPCHADVLLDLANGGAR